MSPSIFGLLSPDIFRCWHCFGVGCALAGAQSGAWFPGLAGPGTLPQPEKWPPHEPRNRAQNRAHFLGKNLASNVCPPTVGGHTFEASFLPRKWARNRGHPPPEFQDSAPGRDSPGFAVCLLERLVGVADGAATPRCPSKMKK